MPLASRAAVLFPPRRPDFEDRCSGRVLGANSGLGVSTGGELWTPSANTGWSTDGRRINCSAGSNNTRRAWMADLRVGHTDLLVAFQRDIAATGADNVAICARQQNQDNDYFVATVTINATNAMDIGVRKRVTGAESAVTGAATATNVATFAAETPFWIRLQCAGIGGNTIVRAKLWKVGDPEPVAWHDSGIETAANAPLLMNGGGIGIRHFVHSGGGTTIARFLRVLQYQPGRVPRSL